MMCEAGMLCSSAKCARKYLAALHDPWKKTEPAGRSPPVSEEDLVGTELCTAPGSEQNGFAR